MSFVVGGQNGFTFIETEAVPALDYDPVRGACTEQDGRLFYEVIPDVYRLLADYDLLPEVWGALLQIASDLLLSLLCADAATNILEVPLDYQRKYQHFDLINQKVFLFDPQPSFTGRGETSFTFSPVDEAVVGVFRSRLAVDRAYWELKSSLTHEASLRFGFRASFDRMDEGDTFALFGYFDSSRANLASSFLVGIGDGGRVLIAQFSEVGIPNIVRTAVVIPPDTEVAVSVEYDAASTAVSVTVIKADDETVLLDDFTFALADGPASEQFTADAFGFMNMDLSTDRSASPAFLPSQVNRVVSGKIFEVTFLDPTLPENIQDIPFLQDQWKAPTFLWTKGIEYEMPGTFLAFKQQPPDFVLAEYVSYNLELIRNNFGESVDLVGPNTPAYRAQVQAMWFALWKGPTIASVRLGIQALLGLPFAEQAGTVASINPAVTGDEGEILIRSRDGLRAYRFPVEVSPIVDVGDEVTKFQALTDGVEIRDWKNSPVWFKPYLSMDLSGPAPTPFGSAFGITFPNALPTREIQKYHVFQVLIDAHIFPLDLVVPIQTFIDRIKPTWKSGVLISLTRLIDDVSMDDPLVVNMIMPLRDRGGGGKNLLDVVYGNPDLQYGQTDPPLTYGMAADLFPDDPLSIILTNISGAPQTIVVNGVPVLVGIGDFVTEDLP